MIGQLLWSFVPLPMCCRSQTLFLRFCPENVGIYVVTIVFYPVNSRTVVVWNTARVLQKLLQSLWSKKQSAIEASGKKKELAVKNSSEQIVAQIFTLLLQILPRFSPCNHHQRCSKKDCYTKKTTPFHPPWECLDEQTLEGHHMTSNDLRWNGMKPDDLQWPPASKN